MATMERRRSSGKNYPMQDESESHDYAQAAKRVISVIQRLEQWFCGEKLFRNAEITSDAEITFRWNYQSKHFEYEDFGVWRKVINAKRPDLMCEFISVCRELHYRAKIAKTTMAASLEDAADEGEKYLTQLSKHPNLTGPL